MTEDLAGDTPREEHADSAPERERAEFESFYREQVPRLVTFLIGQGAALADAANCVQVTLIEAMPPKWATLDDPYAWCRRTALRTFLTARAAATSLVADSGLIDGGPDGDPAPDLERSHGLLRLLAELPDDGQRAVLVCAFDGASIEETAELLDMAPATVRSTLQAARAAARRARRGRTPGR